MSASLTPLKQQIHQAFTQPHALSAAYSPWQPLPCQSLSHTASKPAQSQAAAASLVHLRLCELSPQELPYRLPALLLLALQPNFMRLRRHLVEDLWPEDENQRLGLLSLFRALSPAQWGCLQAFVQTIAQHPYRIELLAHTPALHPDSVWRKKGMLSYAAFEQALFGEALGLCRVSSLPKKGWLT